MYLIKTPRFVKEFFPQLVWEVNSTTNSIYLTFDDGPHPDITPKVLKILDDYNAKATFFCVGENISKYQETFQLLKENGHAVGSHTFNHVNGWATDNSEYFNNVKKGAALAQSRLFRPPYGRIKPSQVKFLSRHYQIIMWDILSGDFDKKLNGEDCYQNVVKHGKSGSVVVFHDSEKSKERMFYALPKILDFYAARGFTFLVIPNEFSAEKKSIKKIEYLKHG